MIKHITYPYQNLDLVDMEGEEWKSCIDYDGYYEVSNKGRVKSVFRTLDCEDGRRMKDRKSVV